MSRNSPFLNHLTPNMTSHEIADGAVQSGMSNYPQNNLHIGGLMALYLGITSGRAISSVTPSQKTSAATTPPATPTGIFCFDVLLGVTGCAESNRPSPKSIPTLQPCQITTFTPES